MKLQTVIPQLDKIYLIFEYCEGDLAAVMHQQRQLASATGAAWMSSMVIKRYLKQILLGIHACHCNRIMHRDMKPQNILIGLDGELKLADFGLARAFSVPMRPFTHEVVTIWYRAPELLLGATEYSIAVDMWSIGCIFFELCYLKPLFNASEEIEMINLIFKDLGTPNDHIWPGYSQLPVVQSMQIP